MDNYPVNLSPEFDERGAIATPFSEWWARVNKDFATVPEDVARYWLYEHWGHSRYQYLTSRDYKFDQFDWPSKDLWTIRSGWFDFDEGNLKCAKHGEGLESLAANKYGYKTAIYMLEHGTFPAPIVVLDNNNDHLCETYNDARVDNIPKGYILVEGHRRFNLALHLQKSGRLRATVPIWMMSLAIHSVATD